MIKPDARPSIISRWWGGPMQPNENDSVRSWVAPRPTPRMKTPISARSYKQSHCKVTISEPARISAQVKRYFASVSSAHGLNQSANEVPLPTLPPHRRVPPLVAGSREHVGPSPWVPMAESESGFQWLQWLKVGSEGSNGRMPHASRMRLTRQGARRTPSRSARHGGFCSSSSASSSSSSR